METVSNFRNSWKGLQKKYSTTNVLTLNSLAVPHYSTYTALLHRLGVQKRRPILVPNVLIDRGPINTQLHLRQ